MPVMVHFCKGWTIGLQSLSCCGQCVVSLEWRAASWHRNSSQLAGSYGAYVDNLFCSWMGFNFQIPLGIAHAFSTSKMGQALELFHMWTEKNCEKMGKPHAQHYKFWKQCEKRNSCWRDCQTATTWCLQRRALSSEPTQSYKAIDWIYPPMGWWKMWCFHWLDVQTEQLQPVLQRTHSAPGRWHIGGSSGFCFCGSAWPCSLPFAMFGCTKLQFGNRFSHLFLVPNQRFDRCRTFGNFSVIYRRQWQFLQNLVTLAMVAKKESSCPRLEAFKGCIPFLEP